MPADSLRVRALFLLFLLAWDLYKCPRSLALLSACLRDNWLTHCLVVLMWGWFGFHGHATRTFAALENPAVAVRRSAKRRARGVRQTISGTRAHTHTHHGLVGRARPLRPKCLNHSFHSTMHSDYITHTEKLFRNQLARKAA